MREKLYRSRNIKAAIFILAAAFCLSSPAATGSPEKVSKCGCSFKGLELKGKIQVVDSFPDIKVQIVTSFPDIKVKKVTSFPSDCGKWQFVDSFPDIKIQYVTSFPDIKVQFVESFPGVK